MQQQQTFGRDVYCPVHGLLLADVSGAGHVHPGGAEHGLFTKRCPFAVWDGGKALRCGVERTVSLPCPEDTRA